MKKIGFAVCLCLGGCKVGPDYTAPEITASNTWNAEDPLVSSEAVLTEWWKVFDDPILTKYIELAAIHNEDVLTAEANILQARAMRTVAASALFPQVSADINATKTYFSKNGPVFAIGAASGNANATSSAATGLPFTLQVPQIQNLYNALFDASWEIDLFGRTRRGVEAAEAQIGSAIEQKNNTLLSVLAEVARNYMEVRSAQRQVELIEKNIDLLEQNAAIVREQVATGYVSYLDINSIEADLATARSALPTMLAQVYSGIYALSILTGNLPEAFVDELMSHGPLPKIPAGVAVGLRSDLLRRRPDVRLSERNLAAATANVGVAVASFYPSIVFSPDAGFQSLKIANLFQAASRTWAVGGNLDLPIFQGGNLVGNLRASRAAAQAAAHTYQQTVLKALQDAETSVKTFSADVASTGELRVAVEKNRTLVELTRGRFTTGLVGKIDLLTQEQQLVSAEQSLLSGETAALVDLVALYKALGGGWEQK